jgi:hypothetical protein
MNSIRRSSVPILWLLSMTAAAAQVWDADKADGPDMARLSVPFANASEVPGASPADVDADTVMRRVRAVIEELKREGPPPVGCMEG